MDTLFTDVSSAGVNASVESSGFAVSTTSLGSGSKGDDQPLQVSSLSDNRLPTVCTKWLGGSHEEEERVLLVLLSSDAADSIDSALTIESVASWNGNRFFNNEAFPITRLN